MKRVRKITILLILCFVLITGCANKNYWKGEYNSFENITKTLDLNPEQKEKLKKLIALWDEKNHRRHHYFHHT